MVSLRVVALFTALAGTSLALPQDNHHSSVLKVRGDNVPTVVHPAFGHPTAVAARSAHRGPAAKHDRNPCDTVRCGYGTVCEVQEGRPTCVKPSDSDEGSGESCGPTTCAEGQVCCNESCGICTPPDGMCITLFCEDPVVS